LTYCPFFFFFFFVLGWQEKYRKSPFKRNVRNDSIKRIICCCGQRGCMFVLYEY
jgi:hypothetical protein